ncbi:MAG: hypothetical protein R3B90_12765 [Planctomycetaceae bacterium]
MTIRKSLACGIATATALSISIPAQAGDLIQRVGCNCQNGGGVVAYQGGAQHFPSAAVEYFPPAADGHVITEGMLPLPAQPAMNANANIAPPPGTLGRTYQIPTRLAPAEEHPRVALLDIRAPGADRVVVEDTYEFRERDSVTGFQSEVDPALWHFKTKPLIPGQPQVVRVETWSGETLTDVRYVRLIKNRIIELTF